MTQFLVVQLLFKVAEPGPQLLLFKKVLLAGRLDGGSFILRVSQHLLKHLHSLFKLLVLIFEVHRLYKGQVALVQLKRIVFVFRPAADGVEHCDHFFLLLGGFQEDVVQSIVDEARHFRDHALLPLDRPRHLVNLLLHLVLFLLKLVDFLDHVHLLLLEDAHHVLALLFEELELGLAGRLANRAQLDFMRLLHGVELFAQVDRGDIVLALGNQWLLLVIFLFQSRLLRAISVLPFGQFVLDDLPVVLTRFDRAQQLRVGALPAEVVLGVVQAAIL